jgi:ABC-type amino acid transport substrate-binding protein
MKIFNIFAACSLLVLGACQPFQQRTQDNSNSCCMYEDTCCSGMTHNKIWTAKGVEADRWMGGRKMPKICSPNSMVPAIISEPIWKRIQQSGKIVVGVKADAPPFSLQTSPGEFMGFEVDLAKLLAKNMGLALELVPVSAKDRSPYVLQEKVDLIMATMTLTHSREEILDFSVPYFEVGQGLIVKSESDVQGFMDLNGCAVAVLEGTQAFHTLSRVQPNCRLLIVSSYEEGIQLVLKGEAEALCSDHVLLTGLLYEHESRTNLRLLQQTFAPDTYAVGMKENESSLRDAVNSGLYKIWEDGAWQDVYETWFGLGSMYGHESMFRIDLIPE